MFSPEEILTLQQDNEQENDVICPILVSSIANNEAELGIEVTLLNITAPTEDDSELSKKYFSVIAPVDKNIWYQIKSIDRTSYLLKLKYNVCVWDQPCFFPLLVTSMCYCNDTIIVGLEDSSIQFIDAEFGLPCLPAMRVEGGIRYLRSFANNLILCISQRKTVTIWSLSNPAELHDVLHVQYYGEMPEIKKVEITNELPNGDISPIIFFKDFAVRWSKSANFWVGYNVKFPRFLIPPTQIQTLADLERQFTDSLIYHDSEKFSATYFELFDFYLQDPSGNNAMILVKQMLARKSEDLEKYCDVPMQELYDRTLNLIAERSPEMLEKIKETKEYQDANRPKPAPTEAVQHHKKSRSRSKLEDDESDDADIDLPEEEISDEIILPEEEDSQEEETSKKRKKPEEPLPIETPELPPVIPQKTTSITQSLSHFLELSNGFDNWDKNNAATTETATEDKPNEVTPDQETKPVEQAAPVEEIKPIQVKKQTPKKPRQPRKAAKLEIPPQEQTIATEENAQQQPVEEGQPQVGQEQPVEEQSTSTMTTRMQTRRGNRKTEAPKPAPKPKGGRRGKAAAKEAVPQEEAQINNSFPLPTAVQPDVPQDPSNDPNTATTEQIDLIATLNAALPPPVEAKPKKQTKRATTPKRKAKNTKEEPPGEPTEPINPDELLQFKINVPQVNIEDVSKVETIEANELPEEPKPKRSRKAKSPAKTTTKKVATIASPVIAKQMVEDEIKKKMELEMIKKYEEELKKQKEAEMRQKEEEEKKKVEEELRAQNEAEEMKQKEEEEKKLIEEQQNKQKEEEEKKAKEEAERIQKENEEMKRIEEENKQKENDEKKANEIEETSKADMKKASEVLNDVDDISKAQLEISKSASPKGKSKASPKGKTTKGHTKQKQIDGFFK